MTQLMLAEICDDGPDEFGNEQSRSMHRALHAIAASTLLEFDSALDWGQWCRVTAAAGIAPAAMHDAQYLSPPALFLRRPAQVPLTRFRRRAYLGVLNIVVWFSLPRTP
jgi:hypothetical protein